MKFLVLILLLSIIESIYSISSPQSRRRIMSIPLAIVIASEGPLKSRALDMEAFMTSELQKSNPPKLTDDQLLCQYGAPSRNTGDACIRAGMSTTRTGTLDAFGNAYRGDFIRCKTFYDDKGDRYEKRVVCQ
jgi:hypothetical protein